METCPCFVRIKFIKLYFYHHKEFVMVLLVHYCTYNNGMNPLILSTKKIHVRLKGIINAHNTKYLAEIDS